MVEHDAHDNHEAMREIGETFKDRGELNTLRNLTQVSLWRSLLFQVIIF